MKTLKLLLVLPLVLLLAGWTGEKPEDTVRAVFAELCTSGDVLKTRKFMANPEQLDELEEMVDLILEVDAALYEKIKADARADCARVRAVEFREVDIRGEEATVRYLQADGEEGQDILARRDGKWKLVLDM